MVYSLALNILAVVWYTISGSVRALFFCGFRYKTPDLDSDVCLVTGAGQVRAFIDHFACVYFS